MGTNAPVAGAVRIGPVYTPREQRGRGYASSAVAAASQQALDEGARLVHAVHSTLANATSNSIYRALGYERFADRREYALSAPG